VRPNETSHTKTYCVCAALSTRPVATHVCLTMCAARRGRRDVQASGVEWGDANHADASSILVHHHSLLRNKRNLLAYLCVSSFLPFGSSASFCARTCGRRGTGESRASHIGVTWVGVAGRRYARLRRVQTLRWRSGRAIPAHLSPNVGPTESNFFREYDRLLMSYQDARSGIGLDLTLVRPRRCPFAFLLASSVACAPSQTIQLRQTSYGCIPPGACFLRDVSACGAPHLSSDDPC